MTTAKPALAVWKFASCDGCQLSLLSLADDLLALAEQIHIAHFLEASSAVEDGPYDISLVEGSITTSRDVTRIRQVRHLSRTVITIGACATAGGIQALRNFTDLDDCVRTVYPNPEHIAALATSTPISDHIEVDYELQGCPVDGRQVLEVISALLAGRRPVIPTASVCLECKRRGITCVMVAGGVPCLGLITRDGCGALCPAVGRGCYGCFGPSETARVDALTRWWEDVLHVPHHDVTRALRTFNAGAPELQTGQHR